MGGGETAAVDAAWLALIFPSKSASKLEGWLKVLQDNEFGQISELAEMANMEWEQLKQLQDIRGRCCAVIRRLGCVLSDYEVRTQASI